MADVIFLVCLVAAAAAGTLLYEWASTRSFRKELDEYAEDTDG